MLWFMLNKNKPMMMRFSLNGTPETLVFGSVKMCYRNSKVASPVKQFSTHTSILGSEKRYIDHCCAMAAASYY